MIRGKKAKTIKKILRTAVDDLIASVDDKEVQEAIKKNTVITGGAIASMLLGEDVQDFDLYFRNKAAAVKVLAYFLKKNGGSADIRDDGDVGLRIFIQSSGVDGRERHLGEEEESPVYETDPEVKPYDVVFVTENAITLAGKIQIIGRFVGDPETIHKYYDFVHCTNYWTSWDNKLVLNPKALECLLTRELIYQGSKYPLCSLIRIRKFVQRGWTITAGQMLKMMMQVSELNLTDVEVLRDQLIGVDTTYFTILIEQVKAADPDKVNAAYLSELIDRLF